MSKPGDWTSNDGARERFLRLVQESGVFLENRLAELSSAFAEVSTHKKGVRVSAESLAYGSGTGESPLRQIDQRVQFYKEFILDDRTGIQLIMSMPIEAKYRRDVEACVVGYPKGSYRPAMPLVSELQGSTLGATLRDVEFFKDYRLAQPVFIEVEKGTTPKRSSGENLVFNAASALYDFIHFDCGAQTNVPLGHAFIQTAKLLERFENYLSQKRYAWWSVVRNWMDENLTSALVSEFNKQCLPERIYFSVHVYIPVLFINGLLHEIVNTPDSGNPAIVPCDAILTRVRVPNWPARLRRSLLGYTAEAPLVITNELGFSQCLRSCLESFEALEASLKRARAPFSKRWPLEAAFYQTVLNRFLDNDESDLRSDLDIFQWLHPLPSSKS